MKNLGSDKDNKKTNKKKGKKEKDKDKDKEEQVEDAKFLNKKRKKEKSEKEEEETEKEELKKKKVEIIKKLEELKTNINDEENKKFKEGIELIEKEMINKIIDNLKNGLFPKFTTTIYMDSYNAIKKLIDIENGIPELLVQYHNKIILDFIDYCFKKFEIESKINFVDNFILYTEKINFLIYWMNRIFTYLDDYYDDEIDYKRLSIVEMDLYKENFFDTIEEKVYKEINKLIKEDRNNNIVERDKIKYILEIIKNLDFIIPQIIKEEKKIKWIELNKINDKKQSKYGDKWFYKFFKNDTITFITEKAELDIKNMSAPEYIRATLKYLNEENKRKIEYIPSYYHKDLDDINSIYLIRKNSEEIAKKDTGIPYMFKNKQFEELKKVFELFILYPDSLDNNNEESNEEKLYINKVAKVLSSNFENYIIERGNDISNNKDISKNTQLFIPELIKFLKEINNFVLNCFSNHKIYIYTKEKSFNKLMQKRLYSKELSNYIDFCMKRDFKGKSPEEVENILDDIIQLYKCLDNKTEFEIDSDIKMSNRLIKNISLSINYEKSLISKFKQESGIIYASKKGKMIAEFEQSKKIIDEYKQSNSKGKPNNIKFNVKVLSQETWIINKNDYEKIKIPKFLDNCIEDFQNFYLKKKGGKLIWCLCLSRIDIQYLCFPNKNISVSTLPQLLTLLLLEKHKKLSLKKISELLECKIDLILKDIPGLIYNPSFNPKGEREKGLILGNFDTVVKDFKPNDEIEFNHKFFLEKLKFNTLPIKTPQQIKEEEEKEMELDRETQDILIKETLERIMKSRIGKTTKHFWLINAVSKQIDYFRAQPKQIKDNIEKLIEENKIRRGQVKTCYEYIA